MIQKKDINELKRRLKKDMCTFTRIAGCYVNIEKEKVVRLNENFLNLEDEEFYKYLEIAKKTLSGTIGNNLLGLKFRENDEEAKKRQQYLLGLKESALKNGELLEHLYDMIIKNYEYAGNYLILVFHDAYDIITKTNDNLKIDESEEVYQYLLCAICPVNLSKPGLKYNKEKNNISPIVQDLVVGMPDFGFLYPSFIDRSSNSEILTYYIKDAKESHAELAECLGCTADKTATEEREIFRKIVKTAIAPQIENSEDTMLEIQQKLQEKVDELENNAEYVLNNEIITEVLESVEIPDVIIQQIKEDCEQEFISKAPSVTNLIDTKEIKKQEKACDNTSRLIWQTDREEADKVKIEKAAGDDEGNSTIWVKYQNCVTEVYGTDLTLGERQMFVHGIDAAREWIWNKLPSLLPEEILEKIKYEDLL